MEIDLDARSIVRMAARYEHAAPIVADETKKSMSRSVIAIEGTAKKNVEPFSDTHTLQRSLTHEVTATGGMVVGKAGTNLKHGKVVEDGRKAGSAMPPPGALLGWMRRKNIPADEQFVGRPDLADVAGSAKVGGGYHGIEYLIARAIARRGIKARPYLKPALQSNLAGIQREFDTLLSQLMKRLSAP